MPLDLRVGGTRILTFGVMVSRITQLTKDDVIEDGQPTWLWLFPHQSPARPADDRGGIGSQELTSPTY